MFEIKSINQHFKRLQLVSKLFAIRSFFSYVDYWIEGFGALWLFEYIV